MALSGTVIDVSSLREEFDELRKQKHVHFDELDRLIRRIVRTYPALFPRFEAKTKGGRTVYHFRVRNVWPISLEKEHKGRDHIPERYAKLAMAGIEDLLTFVEGEQ